MGIHGNGYHLNSQVLANCKMPVISRAGTKEFNHGKFSPGLVAVSHAIDHCPHYGIMHHFQAGTVPDNYLIGGDSEIIGKKGLRFPDAVEAAIIAAINPAR